MSKPSLQKAVKNLNVFSEESAMSRFNQTMRMSVKSGPLLASLLFVALAVAFAPAVAIAQQADAIFLGGGTSDFADPDNWQNGVLPTAATVRWFYEQPLAGSLTEWTPTTTLSGTLNITKPGEIDGGARLNIDGGTLNAAGQTITANNHVFPLGNVSTATRNWAAEINVYNGGTLNALTVHPMHSQSSYAGDLRVKFSGHANATITGTLSVGLLDNTRGVGGGQLTIEGYDSRSALSVANLGVYASGRNTDGFEPALNGRPATGGIVRASLTSANNATLGNGLAASNTIDVSGTFTVQALDLVTLPNLFETTKFQVELNGYNAPARVGDVFQLVRHTTGAATVGSFGSIDWDTEFLMAGHKWKILNQYDIDNSGTIGTGETGLFLVNSAVPEPGTWVLLGIASVGAAAVVRRRKRGLGAADSVR